MRFTMKRMSKRKLPWMVAAAMSSSMGYAAEEPVFELGRVDVTAKSERIPTGTETLDAEQIEQASRLTVGAALDMLPGVNISKVGPRNEEMVYVRGFDMRQVPLLIDGIPVYVSYDGYVDLARFTTFDIGAIDVQKGYSTVLAGPNTLGGVINLVSKRPQSRFEGNIGGGLMFDRQFANNGYQGNFNIGSNQGLWYFQIGGSYLERDFYTLSDAFKGVPTQGPGRRNNSDNRDRKINVKIGLTPNATDEYSLNYINQQGTKGNPPYAGTDPTQTPRYWRWPYWDKESVYYISRTQLGDDSYLKLRAYYDRYKNGLSMYDDATYSSQLKKSSSNSSYDDHTWGASAEVGTKLFAANTLKFAAHIKNDYHQETNAGKPDQHFEDTTLSFGLEDTHEFTDRLSAQVGVSYDRRITRRAEDVNAANQIIAFPQDNVDAWNPQVGLVYKTSPTGKVHFGVAQKSRFPTIKDRYSYRMGTAIPNAGLKPERATNVELGFSERIAPGTMGSVNLFYSDIRNLIQGASIPASACSSPPCTQMQNVGHVVAQGIELSLNSQIGERFEVGGNYTYLNRQNRSDPSIVLTDVPRHKLFLYGKWNITSAVALSGDTEFTSSRVSSSDGRRVAAGFGIANAKLAWKVVHNVTAEFGVRNIFDRNYAYTEGYPEAGRNYYVNLNYAF